MFAILFFSRGVSTETLFPILVLFYDIFSRTVAHLFASPLLLQETLFSAMDKIAKRRFIYKVETVGDCYVGTFFTVVQFKLMSDCYIPVDINISSFSSHFNHHSCGWVTCPPQRSRSGYV